MQQFDGTTILCVRRGKQVALGGDGQVSMQNTRVKGNARMVLSRGEVIVEDGKFLGRTGRGSFLKREARGGAWT